jgi:hypothetical protein
LTLDAGTMSQRSQRGDDSDYRNCCRHLSVHLFILKYATFAAV